VNRKGIDEQHAGLAGPIAQDLKKRLTKPQIPPQFVLRGNRMPIDGNRNDWMPIIE
jgi:hypothetical protein